MANKEIVGWFTRGGKRVPIFKSGNSKGDLRSGKARRAQDEARNETVKTIARIDAGLASGGTMMDKAKARDKRDRLEESLKSDFYKKREPSDRDELRKNVNRKRDKYITEKFGNAKYYSTDYDTSGGHVHKDHDSKSEARKFLRRNGVVKVRRGEGKLTPYYYDSKLGQYHTDEKFNSDAVKADIKEQTRSKTTEHTTTRKARVRSARRKKDGR